MVPKDPDDPPIVLLHGFTQTGVSWAPVIRNLRQRLPDRTVHAPDLPGHGSADPRLDPSSLADAARQLVERFGKGVYVGYSMGGRLALRLAVDHPDSVAALAVVGATAGIDDADERSDRRRADNELADRIEADGVDSFLQRWLSLPLFSGFTATPADLAARHANRAAGLAASLRHAGTGTMDPPLWPDLHRITATTLVCAGSDDARFVALGRRLAAGIGDRASVHTLAGCGHTAHLQAPDRFADLVVELLTEPMR